MDTRTSVAVEFALEKINDEDGRIGVELIDREKCQQLFFSLMDLTMKKRKIHVKAMLQNYKNF